MFGFQDCQILLIIFFYSTAGIADAIAASVFREAPVNEMFPELTSHMMELSIGDNHVFQLIKSVSKSYSKIKLYHIGKEYSDRVTGELVRKKFSKLIHFKNQ